MDNSFDDEGMDRGHAIAIIGMHRSGTSLVAGVTYRLGVAIGPELIAATSYNPLGHFEDVAFQRLNTAILHSAGGDWDSPPSRKELLNAAARYRDAMRRLVRERQASARVWGWKEPRTTLLLAAYRKVIPNLRIVHCVRESREVEQSLERRNGFDPHFSRKLKRHYDREVEWFYENFPEIPHFTVDFGRMRENPEQVVPELAEFAFSEPPAPQRVDAACELILSPAALKRRATRTDDLAYLLRAALRQPWQIIPVLYWRVMRTYWRRKWDDRA